MRKQALLFTVLLFIGFTQAGWGQLLFEDNFEYSLGTLTTNTSNWSESPTGSTDIQIISGNLNYTNYSSSNIGNKINLNGGASGRSGIIRSFTTQSSPNVTVYCSFLLTVLSTTDMDISTNNGDYFSNFQNSALSVSRSYLYVRQGSNSSKFSIGLAKSSSSSLTWFSSELDVNITYLVEIGYTFITGLTNDETKLWINPDLSGLEPSADLTITSGADASDISYIQFKQNTLSGDMDIDGIRVATSWSQAPLPVELTSFSALIKNNTVNLTWQTATEVNNYGFEVEKQPIPNPSQREGDNNSLFGGKEGGFVKVGFVNGAGNSNSPKEYSFTDKTTASGKYLYRLKQIDNDGKYTYSKKVEVNLGNPTAFALEQNYPNPFNPSTSMQYAVSNKQFVTIKVFDILGREVAVLVNGEKEPGTYTAEFATTGLASGTYLYRMQAGDFVQTKKMIILK